MSMDILYHILIKLARGVIIHKMATKKQLYKLYKPVIVRKEVDDEHFYWVNGKYVPGVTRIIQEAMPMPYALRYWIGEVGNEKAEAKLKKAGERGTSIHDACEALLRGRTVHLDKEFPDRKDKKCIVAFIDWAYKIQPKIDPKYIEFTVASRHGYAGTLDLFCYIDKEPWIIDLKTSAGIYDSHMIQLTSYQHAFKEMSGIEAKMGILHLNYRTKKGWSFIDKIQIKKKPVTIDDFLKVFEVYKMINGGVIPPPPITDIYPSQVRLYDEKKEAK